MLDTIVIGAGQSGLAAGYYLQRAGLRFIILDANPQVGGSWQNYWQNLRLFSPAKYSQLPGMDFPGDPAHLPKRDEVIHYLTCYAQHFKMDIRTDTRIVSVKKQGGIFDVIAEDGQTFQAYTVIDATGAFNRPYMPQIDGDTFYQGRVIHSFDYEDASSFAGQRVVVIGANNSAVQIACEVAQVARVSLATRREIKWKPQRVLGQHIFFWFHRTGYDRLPLGLLFDLQDNDMVIDDGRYQQQIQTGNPDIRQMFSAFDADGVIWLDGEHEAVDAVIYATGYRADNKPYLAGLNALCPHTDIPLERGGISRTVDGLYYVGVFGQRTMASATLRGVGADACYVVARLTRRLEKSKGGAMLPRP